MIQRCDSGSQVRTRLIRLFFVVSSRDLDDRLQTRPPDQFLNHPCYLVLKTLVF
jgi:hypothetical protein